jgi:hypothetical protein
LTFGSNAGTTQFNRDAVGGNSTHVLGIGAGGITVESGAGPVTFGTTNQRVAVGAYADYTVANNSSSDLTFFREFDGRGTAPHTVTVAGSGSGNTIFKDIRSYDVARDLAIIINTSGTGIVIFDGNNATNGHRSGTTVTAGTLQLNGSTSTGNGAVHIGTAGTLTGTGTVGGNATLTGGGIINKSAGSIAGTLAVTGGNWNGAGTVTGAVTSSSGTFTIGSGANLTSTGGVSATGGALVVNGTLTGTLNANSSTTVSGTGTITGNTTISGIHSPGNSPGIQSYGSDLSYTSGSSVTWELGANSLGLRGTDFDGINVGGTLDFSGATAVNLVFNFAGSSVDWTDTFWDTSHIGTSGWLVYDVAGTTTNFSNLSVTATNWLDGSGGLFNTSNSGNTFSLYQDGSDIYLNYTVIPEPSAALLGGLGMLLLLRRRRA